MSNSIVLSSMEMTINEELPSADFFKSIARNYKSAYEDNGTSYFIECEYIEEEGCFWLYFRYGNALPYSDTVYNREKEEFQDNPREKSQVEPRQQVFALYSLRHHTLFLSNTKKKAFVDMFFNLYSDGRKVIIRKEYADLETFLGNIKGVSMINLTVKRDLLSIGGNDIFQMPQDIFGLGDPEQMKLEVKYGYAKVTEFFKHAFRNADKQVRDGYAKKLVCVGYDEDRFESIFNTGNIENRISVYVEVNEDGMFDLEKVKKSTLARLRDLYV